MNEQHALAARDVAADVAQIRDRLGWLDYSKPEAVRELTHATLDLARAVEQLARVIAR